MLKFLPSFKWKPIFVFFKKQLLILQGLFAFEVTISMCMWSVAFKMKKKDEKAEDPNSASSEFCKSRKEPNEYFFPWVSWQKPSTTEKKKEPYKPLLLPTVPISKIPEKLGWMTVHTLPDPARQSSENIKICFSWGIVLDYSRITILLWTMAWFSLTFYTTSIPHARYLGGNWNTQNLHVIKWKQTKA